MNSGFWSGYTDTGVNCFDYYGFVSVTNLKEFIKELKNSLCLCAGWKGKAPCNDCCDCKIINELAGEKLTKWVTQLKC